MTLALYYLPHILTLSGNSLPSVHTYQDEIIFKPIYVVLKTLQVWVRTKPPDVLNLMKQIKNSIAQRYFNKNADVCHDAHLGHLVSFGTL